MQRNNVATNVFITSETKTVSGNTGDSWTVSVSGGNSAQYRIASGSFTSAPGGMIAAGQTLTVRHLSSSDPNATVTTTVSVGGYSTFFTTVTGTVDRTPDAFSFGSKGNVAISAVVESPAITLSGYSTAIPIQPGPNIQYRVNNETYTSAAGSLSPGQTVQVKHTASAKKLEYTKTYLKIGGVVGYFTTRTLGPIAPVAVNDRYTIAESTPLSVLAPGVLANDTHGSALTAVVANGPANGSLSLNANGSFTYTPNIDFLGADSFTYKSRDGSLSSAPATVSITVTDLPEGLTPRSRYSLNNKCFALKSASSNKYVAASGAGYAANAATIAGAEGFYLKPSALGEYLLYNDTQQLVTAALAATNPNGAQCTPPATLCNQPLASATDSSIFVVKAAGDATNYPAAPLFDVEPTVAQINAYRGFADPDIRSVPFTLASKPDGRRLTTGAMDAVALATAAGGTAQQFSFETLAGERCAAFPEGQNNAEGETFKGTTSDGRVLGMADTHVHVLSTTFLGGAKSGFPFHKFGVTHAVGDCAYAHGENGAKDGVGAAFLNDTNGHNTTGYPTFPEWPTAGALTHESIYWKWLERAWLGGLRILVNDVVENGTLCELQRNANGTAGERCNEMETAREQIGSMYAMQEYIDAQYGGPGKGWWRVVLTPNEARQVIADGKLAVVIGVEISNLFNCQITYNPARMTEPFEEPGSGTGENRYQCATTETGAPNEIKTQLDQMVALGARQMISIHEFDNAFGGNGIFDGLILNLGNRENSGGNPTPGVPPNDPFAFNPPNETPTGEFWTTYDCPTEPQLAAAIPGDGYLWGSSGGSTMTNSGPPPPLCLYTGQNGRHGGTTACYPAARQCNARWMTPTGLYMYKKLMEAGIIFDFDHMTIDMKTQALELAEAQNPPYPFVSTHGTFGGTTLEQTRRVLKNGGHLYPSLGNGPSLLSNMKEVRDVWQAANVPFLFGFGFGTDTNGLSGQAGRRNAGQITRAGAITYPYQLFHSGWMFDLVPGLDNDNNPATPYAGVTFKQPQEFDETGAVAQEWHIDIDGSAHYGMLSEMVEEVRREIVADAGANPLTVANTQQIRDLFNSAEVYIQTWERTLASRDGILANNNGGKAKEPAAPILRAAPVSP